MGHITASCILALFFGFVQIQPSAAGAIGRGIDACPKFTTLDTADLTNVIGADEGCYEMECTASGWKTGDSLNCLCCVVFNDPHIAGNSNPGAKPGAYDYDFMKICNWAMFLESTVTMSSTQITPSGPSPTAVFMEFFPCPWAGSLTCATTVTFTVGAVNDHRIQIKYSMNSATQDSSAEVKLGDTTGSPHLASTLPATTGHPVKSTTVSAERVVFLFKRALTTPPVTCIDTIWKQGLLVTCPELMIIYYRVPEVGNRPNFIFGMCGRWWDLPMSGQSVFQSPSTGNVQPQASMISLEFYKDGDATCPVNHPQRVDGPSKTPLVLNKDTCKGYTGHLDTCTKTINQNIDNPDDPRKEIYIRGCVSDMCAVTRSARNDADLKRGLNKWNLVAAQVAQVTGKKLRKD